MSEYQITYTLRKPNEPYGYEEVVMTANFESDTAPKKALKIMRKQIAAAFVAKQQGESNDQFRGAGSSQSTDDSVETTDSKSLQESSEDGQDNESEVSDDSDSEKKTASKSRTSKPKKDKKKFKKVQEVYDREKDNHKALFSEILNSIIPKWRDNPDTKALCIRASKKLVGTEFLDEDGNILAGFTDTVIAFLDANT